MMLSRCSGFVLTFTLLTVASSARAQDAPTSGPTIGGHLGMALPIVTFADKVTGIGADFVTLGITPGISVNLDKHWTIDFEFVVLNEVKNTPAKTTFVVDPGVVYHFPSIALGLRVASEVGAPSNVGLVPIIVVPFKISKVFSYFIEGDIPLFLRDAGTKIQPSASFQFQTGVGF